MTGTSTKGIWLMVASVASFAVQDGFSRLVAEDYNTLMVVAVRYWVFAVFVLARALQMPGGLSAVRTRKWPVHLLRAALLVAEILLMVQAYTMIGLIQSHAVFAVCPLLVVAMSGPILGERISAARWGAVALGLVGVLVIERPGFGVFTPAALMPLGSALMFGLFSVLTRATTRDEPTFPSFFWIGVMGAVLMTPFGLWAWEPVRGWDWVPLLTYAGVSVLSNWLLTKTYQVAEASAVQPFAYLQIVFVAGIGLFFFGEVLDPYVALGAAVVIGAGLYALVLARREGRRPAHPETEMETGL
jgi:drug/metabolite transporter (DMT)-like permease